MLIKNKHTPLMETNTFSKISQGNSLMTVVTLRETVTVCSTQFSFVIWTLQMSSYRLFKTTGKSTVTPRLPTARFFSALFYSYFKRKYVTGLGKQFINIRKARRKHRETIAFILLIIHAYNICILHFTNTYA